MLQGRVAVVTGGSRGIGRGIVLELVKNGAKVGFTYHKNQGNAEEVVKEVEELGGEAIALQADVSDFEKAKEIIQTVKNYFNGLDILVNNAGVNADKPFFLMQESEWNMVIDTNLKGTINYSRAVIVPFLKAESGCIVNISSIGGIVASPGQTNYCSSKAAIIHFTRTLAKETAARKVRVNAIAPGFIDTDMTQNITEKRFKELLSQIPMKRIGTVEEIGKGVVFLASNVSSYITGHTLVIDGGLS